MIMNEAGLKIIKKYEGLRLAAYQCPAGIWTIGYGHTNGVRPGDEITAERADELLISDVEEIEHELQYILGHAMLNVNQWSALVSLILNIGSGQFEGSTLRRLLPYSKARSADEFMRWKLSKGQVLIGLVERRKEERALFLK